ncbi:DUF445 domain-containing protein [Phenylobacterium sp. LjRoot219]|uniref:DUF445 domain-containing protein n=1 Tax=Phenylobacterium sp. LjRoot219 TaxID=3342283 RepID=UPI003ECC943A
MSGSAGLSADALRARDLARMRMIATGLLALMAVVFVLASLARAHWPQHALALGYVRAFAEAGMVGACADWFAVTALFRHPFGLPIPHTGIIPRNKDRIGQALGGFIADNFLTEAVLEDKLKQLELAGWGGDWLSNPRNARRLATRVAHLAPEILRSAPPGAVGELAGSAAMAAARATPAAPLAAGILSGLWSEGRAQVLFDRAVELLGGYMASHPDAIRDRVVEQAPKWLPKWVDRMLADRISEGLVKTVEEMRDPAHPWREELRDAVMRLIVRLREDPELQAQVEAFKLRLLADPRLQSQAGELWAGMEARLGAELAADRHGLAEQLQRAILGVGAWLSNDAAAQTRLNTLGRSLATGVIAPRRQEIGRFVAQVVAGWDAKNVVDKLELQVGKDLQYIRINGTLVGGLVGLIIFATSRALGLD